jgi:hypothetical protein
VRVSLLKVEMGHVKCAQKPQKLLLISKYFCCLSSSLLYCVENIEKVRFKSKFAIQAKI